MVLNERVLNRVSLNLLALVLINFVVALGSNSVCKNTNIRVPELQAEYMLNGDLVVSWKTDVATKGNYSASYCCEKPLKEYHAICSHVCPKYKKLKDCSLKGNSVVMKYQCHFRSSQYLKYTIVLNDETRNCYVNGSAVNITPQLRIAHAPGIEELNMITKRDGVLLSWTKADYQYLSICYFGQCYVTSENGSKRNVVEKSTMETKMFLPFQTFSEISMDLTCCVKVRACGMTYAPFSELKCVKREVMEAGAVSSSNLFSPNVIVYMSSIFLLTSNGA